MKEFFRFNLIFSISVLILFGCGGDDGTNEALSNKGPSPDIRSWGMAELLVTHNEEDALRPQIALYGDDNAIRT